MGIFLDRVKYSSFPCKILLINHCPILVFLYTLCYNDNADVTVFWEYKQSCKRPIYEAIKLCSIGELYMKLLIVDDGRVTRTGLISSIDWDSLGITEILQAE